MPKSPSPLWRSRSSSSSRCAREDAGEAPDPGAHAVAVEASPTARYQVSAGRAHRRVPELDELVVERTSVSEQPDMSSDVTYGPTSDALDRHAAPVEQARRLGEHHVQLERRASRRGR